MGEARACRCRFTKTEQLTWAINHGLQIRGFLNEAIKRVRDGRISEDRHDELIADARHVVGTYKQFLEQCGL